MEMALLYAGVVMLLIMMLLGTADVIARYIFSSPIKGTLELSQLLMAGAILLGWGYAQATSSNIRVDFVIMRYRPTAKFIVELIILLLTLSLFIFIAWQSFKIAMLDVEYGRLIENVYLPAFPFKLMVTFGAIMVCLESIFQMVRLIFHRIKKSGVN